MFAKIAQAEEACGVRGSVTLATLNDALSSQVWSELENAESLTSMVLLSSAFKNESTAEDCIDATNLRCFALLHCVGSPADKAQALYEILSGVGGVQKLGQVSVGDEHFKQIFRKICCLATKDILELGAQT